MGRIYILLFFLMAACCFDYYQDRIPNGLIAFGMLTAVCCRAVSYMDWLFRADSGSIRYLWKETDWMQLGREIDWLYLCQQIGSLLVQAGTIFAALYLFYRIGVLGAGDVKLYCMSAVFLDSTDFIPFFAAGFCLAAAGSLLKLLYQKSARERLCYFCSYVADIVRLGRFKLYWEDSNAGMKKKASLHMAGPMLAGLLFHMCGLC